MRIAQVSVYYGLFDEAMPPSFREEREAFARQLTDWLGAFGEVIFPGLVHSEESADEAARLLAGAKPDVIVFAPTMAAPPSYGWKVVAALDRVPVLAVAAQEITEVPRSYDTEEATRRSAPVGLAMFTNVLVRNGRPLVALAGRLGSPELDARLRDALAGAAGAAALAFSRIGLIGAPLDGYLDVEATGDELAALGPELVGVGRADLSSAFAAAAADEVEAEVDDATVRFDASGVKRAVLTRSAHLFVGLRALVDQHGLDAAAVNCHGDHFRWNPDVGITACYAVARLSERGIPVACTGDVPTAAALLLGRAVARSALYCELYAMDIPGNWVLVANGGEGDLTCRAPGSGVRLLTEDHYLGDHGPGTAVAFSLPEGPATLLSLSPMSGDPGGWRMVVALGRVLGSVHERLEGPNAMFRFASGAVEQAFAAWCAAGAVHHAALLPGDHAAVLETVASLLGIRHVAV